MLCPLTPPSRAGSRGTCRSQGNRRLFSWDTAYFYIFGNFKSSAFEEVFAEVKLPAHRAGLPGNVDMITESAFLPAYLPTGRQARRVSSRLARGNHDNNSHIVFGPSMVTQEMEVYPHGTEAGKDSKIKRYLIF